MSTVTATGAATVGLVTTGHTATEDRARKLLGQGIPAAAVASALGVSESRISQLMSDKTFAAEVQELRFHALQKHNDRDISYDTLEDSLLVQLKRSIPMLLRPMEITKVLQVVNAAKRRGVSAPDATINQQNVVNITMPTKIVQQFTTNVNNQVITAGTQDLNTIQSGAMKTLLAAEATSAALQSAVKEISHDIQRETTGEAAQV